MLSVSVLPTIVELLIVLLVLVLSTKLEMTIFEVSTAHVPLSVEASSVVVPLKLKAVDEATVGTSSG